MPSSCQNKMASGSGLSAMQAALWIRFYELGRETCLSEH